MTITINKEQFKGYGFSEEYIKWIKESTPAVKLITANEIKIKSDDKKECYQALIFLGYAWGQQDNGR